MDKQERINVLENLWKVFQSVPPGLASQIAPELRTSWESALKSFNAPIKIDLDKLSDLLDCKVTFENRTIKHDEKIQITLYIRSTTEVPLKLKNFAVILTDTNVNVNVNATKYSEYSNENEERLKDIEEFLLESDKCYKIHFSGDNYQFMENVDVQILKIEIQMGSNKIFAILTQKTKLNVSKPFKAYNPHKDCMESIPIISWCYITPTFHLSAQTKQNNQPMLTNEFYKVTTKIFNSSDVCLQNVGACISVPPHFINKAFLTTDLMQPMQKISSNIQIDIGELQSQSESKISYYVTSLVEGNVELKQKLFYQTENPTTGKQVTNTFTIDSPTTPNSEKEELAKMIDKNSQKYLNTHNIIIEYIDDQVKKIKEDTIIVPCIEELRVVGRFYTLSREALLRAYRNEDFLLRLCLEVKAPDAIDILESVFITDHNLVERPYKGQPNVYGSHLKSGTKFEDIKILNSCSVTEDWVSHDAFFNDNNRLIFKHDGRAPRTVDNRGSVPLIKNDESFNRNLLLKIPSNATIISSNMSTTSLTGLAIDSTDDLKIKSFVDVKSADEGTVAKSGPITRNIYNCAIDGVKLTSNERNGFITAGICAEKDINVNGRIFGVYCVKWRRSGSTSLNESKFVINGIEIIEPPLNLYCYVEEKMYVRVPMTLKITLRNPTRKIIHLQAILNGSDSFMYSGHRQLNVSIFSYSTFELSFMLYPLKAGWQPLPEFLLEYINYNQNTNSNISQQQLPNVNEASLMQNDQTSDPGDREKLELTNLVKRWMPKMVFIHPPQRHLQ